MITVVSLGAAPGDLTLRGLEALKGADEVFARTREIPALQTLGEHGIAYTTFDGLYEKSRNYDTLAKKIAAEVKRHAKGKNVCYCVDGCAEEDRAAMLLIERGATSIGGGSKASHYLSLAKIAGEYTAVSAFSVSERKLVLPLVVYDLTPDNIGDVKLLLAEKFGDEAPAFYISGEKARSIPLYEADRVGEFPAGLVLPEQPLLTRKRFDLEDLYGILKRLRAPDGCPWDRVQTHESIRINAIEEAYELVDALDEDDFTKIREEAGDVLMQALFHTLMEEERGNFTLTDMLSEVCLKLISRHTHVFGQDRAASAEGALSVWEKNKMTEKHQATYSDAVNDVPEVFPALLRAQKIAKRMEKGGWDKATLENFEKKFREEYAELKEALAMGDGARIKDELGDVLFCTVELGRAAGVDCEMALLDTVKKCAARYNAYESLVLADGKDVHALTDAEKEEYYRRAKHAAHA